VRQLAPGVLVVESVHRPVALVNSAGERAEFDLLRESPVLAFCGLGNPNAFRQTLTALRAEVADFRAYPDHHPYALRDVEELRAWAECRPGEGAVVTTQKDLVKLRLDRLGRRRLWALRVRLEVTARRQELEGLLESALA
jgi:tetraacyldisaccharide 4'-kinase